MSMKECGKYKWLNQAAILNNNCCVYIAENVEMPQHDALLYRMFRKCNINQQAIIERILCEFVGMSPREFMEKEQKNEIHN